VFKIFIPIKKNSHRVSGKNFREFGGKKLYMHTLSKYEGTGCQIFVDTDSEEVIQDVEGMSWISAYRREEHLLGGETSVNKLIDHFVNKYCKKGDIVGQIHVTSPFLSPETVLSSFRDLQENDYDSIASADLIQARMWRNETYGNCPINHNPMKLEQTQDLPVYYVENSAFYIFTFEQFNEGKNRIGNNNKFVPISFPENLDIDTEDDWNYCLKINEAM